MEQSSPKNILFQLRLLILCLFKDKYNCHISSVIVCDVDFKINNTSINEQPLIAKKFFGKCDSIIVSVSVYHCMFVKIHDQGNLIFQPIK